ncbi:hypothetical protein [Flavobacterium facile]|uniref:hypothetical protein n=1 Tax=Flavobacterium facile TaxID=2893174 RepID=UPI002E79EAB4|nr:hypothetical protein [Flavobacterium sp. T-12]
MSKDRKTKPYAIYNKSIIKRLIEKHGFTPHFIYASLRGDRTSESSTKICEDYKLMETEMNKVLKSI